jgi:hypothetical protein
MKIGERLASLDPLRLLGIEAPKPNLTRPAGQPVLAQTQFQQTATGPVNLRFQASAPGSDFGVKGKEDAPVAVFVNGKYFSTEAVLKERGTSPTGFGNYSVNLGSLPPGSYNIELRSAAALVGENAPAAKVQAVKAEPLSGLSAQIARYSPMIATRRANTSLLPSGSASHDPRQMIAHSDVPVHLRAEVQGDPNGIHSIQYRVTFTDEDGGTPDKKRGQVYGRTIDDEWAYKVLVDGQGNKVSPDQLAKLKADPKNAWMSDFQSPEMYQFGEDSGHEARHQHEVFDGVHLGDRPVLRVNSSNNNFAPVKSMSDVDTALWSAGVDFNTSFQRTANGQPELGHQSDKDVLRQNAWIAEASAKEIAREPNDASFERKAASVVDKIKAFLGL